MEQDRDYILCECAMEPLQAFIEETFGNYSINLTKTPSIFLTMVRAEDSVEKQEFYLGEALTTDCEVEFNGSVGYGICLGDEPERAYCMAVIDAMFNSRDTSLPIIQDFLTAQWTDIQQREKMEFSQIMRTKVDFKLMEQS